MQYIVDYRNDVVQQVSRSSSFCFTETWHPLISNVPFLPPPSAWQPPFHPSILRVWLFLVSHINEIMQYLSFYEWLISFSITSSRFIYGAAYGRISLVRRLSNISLCAYRSHFPYPFICQWTVRLLPHLGSGEAAMNIVVLMSLWGPDFNSFG